MLEIFQAGGSVMWLIVACSVIALAIVIERFWSLRTEKVVPAGLSMQVWQWAKKQQLDARHINELRGGSPLGRIMAAGLANRDHPREVMKEAIEETGRHVVHELERFLNTLGTIAAVTPLLGLLGTVMGMISVFSAITTHGVGDPTILAGGISQALLTTAGGLTVGIPSLMFYRYFRGRVDELVVAMEQEALKLVEVLLGQRANEQEAAE